MNCLLIYFTGTFNTRYITNMLKGRLEGEGWTVSVHEIDPLDNRRLDLSAYDIIGLGLSLIHI